MRKTGYAAIMFFALILLSSCGAKEELTDYIDVSFDGMDSQGKATYDLDEEKLLKEVFDYDDETDFADDETEEEIEDMEESYKIKVDPEEDLSNGDTVTLTASVDEEKTDKIEGGEQEFEVEELDEPDVLSSEDVEDNLVLNFNGPSGKGEAMIENQFDTPLDEFEFEIKDDGELKNGDNAEIKADKDQLLNKGYVTEEGFDPSFEVKGLDNVANKATDIKNLDDIERMIKEEVEDKYEDRDTDLNMGVIYEIDKKATLYRPFESEDDDEEQEEDNGLPNNVGDDELEKGSLVSVYEIKQYSGGDDKEKEDEFTAVIGFTDIILDDDDKANVSDIEEMTDEKDEKYSADSVIEIYLGNGYEKVDD